MLVPTVIEKTNNGERAYDLYSRLMKDRIILLTGEINDAMASIIVGQLLFLAAEDPKKDIQMYINSPGGSISAGFAIYDTMNYIKCDVSTICVGVAASMGAFLLSGGTKGKRYCLPNSEVLIHQPLIGGGVGGQSTDIKIISDHLLKNRERLTALIAQHTGQDYYTVLKDTERDNWMSAEQAKAYGLVDSVL